MIDEEVHDLVQTQYERAREVLKESRDKLDAIAERLLEVETLGRNDFLILMGEEPEDDQGVTPEPTPGAAYAADGSPGDGQRGHAPADGPGSLTCLTSTSHTIQSAARTPGGVFDSHQLDLEWEGFRCAQTLPYETGKAGVDVHFFV